MAVCAQYGPGWTCGYANDADGVTLVPVCRLVRSIGRVDQPSTAANAATCVKTSCVNHVDSTLDAALVVHRTELGVPAEPRTAEGDEATLRSDAPFL